MANHEITLDIHVQIAFHFYKIILIKNNILCPINVQLNMPLISLK